MAKKSSAKSGTKKKTAAKKKTTAAKKPAAKKTAATKKAAASKAKAKPKAKAQKKVTVKDLIRRKFDAWKPEPLFQPPVDEAYANGFSAPAFDASVSRDVLMRKFDFNFADVAVEPAPPKPKRTIEELMRLKFDAWKPASYFSPPVDEAYLKGFSAPPFGASVKRDVLMRKFDFSFADVAVEPAPPKPKRTIEELMRLKFDAWKPASYFTPPENETYLRGFSAPPFGASVKRDVLMRKFDFSFAEVAVEPAPPKPKRTIEELMRLKFDAWKPASYFSPPVDEAYLKGFSAPPFGASVKRDVLMRKFDFTFEDVARKPEPPAEPEKAAPAEAASEETPPETPAAPPSAPVKSRTPVYAVLSALVLVTLLLAVSYSNSNKYYLKTSDAGVEIWKGRFAPVGMKQLDTLEGMEAPETLKDIYGRVEVYNLAFQHYRAQADALMQIPEFPDLDQVQAMLEKSMSYAVTGQDLETVKNELGQIHLGTFLYQSDMAASRGELKEALDLLDEAGQLPLNEQQARLVQSKIRMLNEMIAQTPAASETVSEAPKDAASEEAGSEKIETETKEEGHH